jgi:hypothetical protein
VTPGSAFRILDGVNQPRRSYCDRRVRLSGLRDEIPSLNGKILLLATDAQVRGPYLMNATCARELCAHRRDHRRGARARAVLRHQRHDAVVVVEHDIDAGGIGRCQRLRARGAGQVRIRQLNRYATVFDRVPHLLGERRFHCSFRRRCSHNFLSPVLPWLPDGQITEPLSSPLCKNILVHFRAKSPLHPSHPVPPEGRIAIVTDVGCGMRWTRQR